MVPAPPGPAVYLPRWRLRVWVRVGGAPRLRQAVFDTGAPAAVLSKDVWRPFADDGRIEWVGPPPGASPGPLPRAAVLGGVHPFRLGRMTIELADLDGNGLPAVPVYVQCLEEPDAGGAGPRPLPRLLVVGMGGILNGRALTLSASPDGTQWAGWLAG
jgi:hypothetical protein